MRQMYNLNVLFLQDKHYQSKNECFKICLGIYKSWKQIPEVTFFLDHFYKNIRYPIRLSFVYL